MSTRSFDRSCRRNIDSYSHSNAYWNEWEKREMKSNARSVSLIDISRVSRTNLMFILFISSDIDINDCRRDRLFFDFFLCRQWLFRRTCFITSVLSSLDVSVCAGDFSSRLRSYQINNGSARKKRRKWRYWTIDNMNGGVLPGETIWTDLDVREKKRRRNTHEWMIVPLRTDAYVFFSFFFSFSIEAEYSSRCMISSYPIFNLFEQVTEQYTMPVAMKRRLILGFYCFLKQ